MSNIQDNATPEELTKYRDMITERHDLRRKVEESEARINIITREMKVMVDEITHRGFCQESVYSVGDCRSHKCTRKAGHGKDGNYCKQHAKRYPAED